MKLLMFSGNSARNRDWIYEAKSHFTDLFSDIYIQDYRHWETGQDWIDLQHELAVLSDKQSVFGDNYGVFAKSIGTVLATQAIAKNLIKPQFLMLCGLPLGYIEQQYPVMAEVLASSRAPMTVIHNQYDTVGSAADAAAYMSKTLANRPNYHFIEVPGNTHDYEDYELLGAQLMVLAGSGK